MRTRVTPSRPPQASERERRAGSASLLLSLLGGPLPMVVEPNTPVK